VVWNGSSQFLSYHRLSLTGGFFCPAESINLGFNYLVDLYTKWYRNYFYFCAKYCSPGPNALSPYFEIRFARMEYVGPGARFNLFFMRHTGQWVEIYRRIPLDECFSAIECDPWFQL
jgi:hypothetical protein